MVQEVFQRLEKKYLMTEAQYGRLMLAAGGRLQKDEYGEYQISNIYFDTPDFLLVRRSLEKPVYKEKLRLRAYGRELRSDSQVFMELKKKYDSVVYKRRIAMELKVARACFYNREQTGRDDQILKELDFAAARYGLMPKAYISYERTAYFWTEDPSLRVTFDRKLLGRDYELELSLGSYGSRIIEEGLVLMELKAAGAIPMWLCHALSENGIFPCSFSKYGTYYRKLEAACRETSREENKDCA